MVEAECVERGRSPLVVDTPSNSGRAEDHTPPEVLCSCGATIPWRRRDPLRASVPEEPPASRPTHIFTSTKQPWVVLPAGARVFSEFYDPKQEWPAATLARYKAARERHGMK
jgi:hypothetical protein